MQLQRPHPVDLHAGSPRDLRSPRRTARARLAATAGLPPVVSPLVPRHGHVAELPALTDAHPRQPVGGERDWQPRGLDARGSVLVATAFIRPDPDHAGFVSATLAPAGRYLQPDQRDFCYPTLAKSPA